MTRRSKRVRRPAEFTLPEECHARLEELHEKMGVPRSQIVEQMILDWVPPPDELIDDS